MTTILETFGMCPITHETMRDPVTNDLGFTYERAAIERWFEENNTDPLTNIRLDSLKLTPNRALHVLIQNKQSILSQPNQVTTKQKRAWCREKYGPDWWKVDKKERKREAARALH